MPQNYIDNKEKMTQKKNLLETIYYTEEEQKEVYLRFINTFLECFKQEIKQSNKDILLNLMMELYRIILWAMN